MIFETALVSAALLCSLVAGFLFAFAAVAMPGIGRLKDRSFIRAFQEIDGVIQNNQPIFLLVWVGSAITLIASATIGFFQLDGTNRSMLIGAAVVYLLGVQLPTVRVNIPMNNAIQALNIETMNDEEAASARNDFEGRWNRWNLARTLIATAVALALHLLLLWI